MFGPTYEAACPGCTGLADPFDAALAHLNNRDVTLIAISRAPIEKLAAYKRRMGWQFPYVSSYRSDFNFDFDFALTEEQMATGEPAQMVEEAPEWLHDWAENVGTDLAHGMAEAPGWSVFALEGGIVYHTYSRTAPDCSQTAATALPVTGEDDSGSPGSATRRTEGMPDPPCGKGVGPRTAETQNRAFPLFLVSSIIRLSCRSNTTRARNPRQRAAVRCMCSRSALAKRRTVVAFCSSGKRSTGPPWYHTYCGKSSSALPDG